MNDKQMDDYLKPMIEGLKLSFSGSPDYHSGINDGMYKLGKRLLSEELIRRDIVVGLLADYSTPINSTPDENDLIHASNWLKKKHKI